MKFFDAHAHLQFAAFDDDREEVIGRAREAGVILINVGTQADTSAVAIRLAETHEGMYATVGLHPIHTEKSYHDAKELGDNDPAKGFTSRGETFDFDTYEILAKHDKVVGIGECGLDYYRLELGTKENQLRTLIGHLELAYEVEKPLMIHCRQAFPDLIETLKSRKNILNDPPGVIHFFTGTKDDARELLDLGFAFTFGGVVTFARDYDVALEFLPLEAILSETDAPYVTPMPYRGKRNEPAYVVEVVKKLAEIKKISTEEMARWIAKNAERVFGV